MADSNYVAAGTYYDGGLSQEEKTKVEKFQTDWLAAYRAGDQAGMNAAHAGAEAVRASSANAYSGGADGTKYIPLQTEAVLSAGNSSAARGGEGGYSAYQYPAAASAEDYVREIYAAQQEASLAALKSAYEQNVLELDGTASKIPVQYTAARNSASGASEIERAAFNEYAAANGLGSGAGGQAQLSMSNALLGSLASISQAESNAMSEIEMLRAKLGASYKSSIAEAVAQGNFDLAQALYTEFVRLDDAKREAASAQAAENYRAYMANRQ